ncbi:MAG: DUF5916 domain-containing protein [Woeseia sp.]
MNAMQRIGRVFLSCLVAAAAAASGNEKDVADGTEKTIPAVRTATAPVLDGHLDDPVWRRAAIVDDLHMVVPNEHDPPSEESRIFVLYGADALYFAARFYDREPDKVSASVLRQGDFSWGEDGFSIILDPFNKGRNGYMFDINPNGVRTQALFTNVTEQNWAWQGIWHGAAQRDEEGWTAEVAIPFKSLSFEPDVQTWGINFTRWLGRRNERFGWVSHNLQQNPATSGRIEGLTDIEQGLGLDVVAGVRIGESRDYASGRASSSAEPSVDIFYKLTPAITAALTANTDFSGTTVDTRQINLTRFELFFPEKRKFFLQDADMFEFGRIGDENAKPFFSRRIGLSLSADELDIDVGAKFTGRAGRFDVGLVSIRQDAANAPGPSNLLVGRIAANVLSESSLGLIVTEGDPASQLDNTLYGFDFRYLNTRWSADRTIEAAAWYQSSETEGLHGSDAAFGASFEIPARDGWLLELDWKEIQENYYPALGFVNRTGVREYEVELNYMWRPAGHWLRSIVSGAEISRTEKIDGRLESQEISLRAVELRNHAADVLEANYLLGRERLTEPFEIAEGIVIPPGDYAFDSYCVEAQSGEHRVLTGAFFHCGGEFYDGTRQAAGGELTWRPSRHFRFSSGVEWNGIELPQGSFITRLASLRADVAFTATWYWENFLQYDNVSETMGMNSILRWVPDAGTEAVLVINRLFQDFDRNNRFESQRGDLAFKIGYTLRF